MSSLEPARLALGCEQLGGTDWGDVDVDEALAAVRYAWDHGVRSFDTADVYGLGMSETRLSEALGRDRHEARIITKFGVRWDFDSSSRARTWRDASPDYLRSALDASLRRLRIDCIPVYLVHWPDPHTDLDETLAALESARDEGKIAAYGVSNHRGAALQQAISAGATAVELPLSLIARGSRDDLRVAGDAGVHTLAYGIFAQGLLTGRFGPGHEFPASDRRHRLEHFAADAWQEHANLLARVSAVAGAYDTTPAQVALQWVLGQSTVTTAIVGARNEAQVASTISGLEKQVSAAALARLSVN